MFPSLSIRTGYAHDYCRVIWPINVCRFNLFPLKTKARGWLVFVFLFSLKGALERTVTGVFVVYFNWNCLNQLMTGTKIKKQNKNPLFVDCVRKHLALSSNLHKLNRELTDMSVWSACGYVPCVDQCYCGKVRPHFQLSRLWCCPCKL